MTDKTNAIARPAAPMWENRTARRSRAVIIPDYARPAALMVPHYGDDAIRPLLEEIASAASRWIGVILLSPDPYAADAFVARQLHPERFSVVGAHYDTPWIRDRAPIAIRDKRGVRWVLPRMPDIARELDDRLFATISARPSAPAPLIVAQGNLVAGPNGVGVSTKRILLENGLGRAAELEPFAPALGIRHWLIANPFPDEPSGHADVHMRFLRADLMAVAWGSEPKLRERAAAIEQAVRSILPGIRSLRIPLERTGKRYASLVNWIQIGRNLLVPSYDLTAVRSFSETKALLESEGFRVHRIFSPTLDLGGSLHCLTASVFV